MTPLDGQTIASAPIRQVCVFCGARPGSRPEFMAAARALGEQLVKEGLGLVYGGGTVGLMGQIAKTVYSSPENVGVMGVIPQSLHSVEVSGEMIGDVHIVTDMHARKAMMAQHSDAFIAMPGGFGTLEEVLEVITWQQLGFHTKPIGFYNVSGFFDPLLQFFQSCVSQGFISQQHNSVLVSADPAELLQMMRKFKAPTSLVQQCLDGNSLLGTDVSRPSTEAEGR